jgi:hypothetical protein
MECPKPTCLVLLVHGLWGWKTDWHKTNKALESHNDGSCLFHISAVNLGFLTYDGEWPAARQ